MADMQTAQLPLASPDAGQWLRPMQAAETLGVSDRTLRRYVASGRYQARRSDGALHVFVPAGDASRRSSPALMQGAIGQAVLALHEALTAERTRTHELEVRLRELETIRLQLVETCARLSGEMERMRVVRGVRGEGRRERPES